MSKKFLSLAAVLLSVLVLRMVARPSREPAFLETNKAHFMGSSTPRKPGVDRLVVFIISSCLYVALSGPSETEVPEGHMIMA